VTNISKSFTYKIAAEINWHRYGTKLRHCRPVQISAFGLSRSRDLHGRQKLHPTPPVPADIVFILIHPHPCFFWYCFFWYWPTRVVPDKRPLNGCCCCPSPSSFHVLLTCSRNNNFRLWTIVTYLLFITYCHKYMCHK